VTDLYVIAHNRIPGVHAPGLVGDSCAKRGCAVHTADWRATPGSPENTHCVRASMVRTPLLEALAAEYGTEAHIAAYSVTRDGVALDRQPRVRKDSLPWLRAQGFEVVTTAFMADADTPGHIPWTEELLAAFRALWASGVGPLATCGMYLSPKGYRLVQPLDHPLPVEDAEARLRTWLRQLVAAGVDPRVEDVHDWTRLMRTPHHRRPTGVVRSPWVDLGRMVRIAPPEPARDALVPVRRRASPRGPVGGGLVPMFVAEVPPGWEGVADALGAAIRDTVRADWRRCYLALAGALCDRGCPSAGVPAVVGRAHAVDQSYSDWETVLGDRVEIARSTVVRWTNRLDVAGYTMLARDWPAVAAALDATTTSGAEARVLAQLRAPAPKPVPVAEAVATIERELASAPAGVTLIAAPPGTGKTHAVAEYAQSLPAIGKRAAPGARVAVSSPTHKLAKQTAAKLDRSLHLFSPPSHTGPDGRPTCIYAEAAGALAAGGQSAALEFCEGRGRAPCEMVASCPAYAGQEGDPHATLVTGVHGLVRQLRAKAGAAGLLVVDEPGEVLSTERVTADEVDTARRYLDAFVSRYARAIRPALEALAAWMAEAPLDDALVPLPQALAAGARSVPLEVLDAAGADPEADPAAVVLSELGGAIDPAARSKAPPLTWSSVVRARASAARAHELGAASRVLDLLYRGATGAVPYGARIDDRSGDRAVTLTGPNADLLAALAHEGPVVVLDANAALHAAGIAKAIGYAPRLVELAVADGAPIARTVLVCPAATRRTWLPSGVPDWSAILPALRAALAWASEDPATQRVGLILPRELHVAVAHALRPDAPATAALVKSSRVPRRALDAARTELAPVLGAFAGEIVTGHYGALEGLDYMADCDATITLGDPRPNLLAESDKAAYLGLDADGRLDALAAAELQQAHGRLRTVHRTRPGRQLHVGTVVPGGWAGLAVDVRRMPSGRPRTAAAGMDGAEMRTAREGAGMGLRELARALGVSDKAVRRYESGEREIPEAVVRAVRALGLGAAETPLQIYPYQGVSAASSVQVSPSRGFGRTPLQGVSAAPSVNSAPRKARRIDLGALTAPAARTGTDDGGTR